MAHIVTLKDHNDEISYPITPVDAVFVDSNTTLSEELADIVNKIYPVGSIYMSATLSTAAAVGAAIGGTWAAWGSGRVPVGVDTNDTDFDTAEETGGEKAHQLINDELPKLHGEAQVKVYDSFETSGIISGKNWAGTSKVGATNNNSQIPFGIQIDFGQNAPHNNLQPYITCYMYKRIA